MNEFVSKYEALTRNIQIIEQNRIRINEIDKSFELHTITKNKYLLKVDDRFYDIALISNNKNNFDLVVNNSQLNIEVLTTLQEKALQLIENAASSSHHQTEIKSPMPGMVLKVYKKSGDKIHRGEAIMVLEAMKMENEIKAPRDGIIAEIKVEQGKPVEKNVILFTIE